MKVCFVTPYGYPVLAGDRRLQVVGGAEVQQSLIAAEMARRGHDVSMISLDFGDSQSDTARNVRIIKAYRPDAGIYGLRAFHPRLTKLWAAMKRADADIYYQQTSGPETGYVAAFARWKSKRMVFSAASDKDFDVALTHLNNDRHRLVYRKGIEWATKIVVQSERQRIDCLMNFQRESIRLESCCGDNGKPGAFEGEIIWVGNTKPHKRPEIFLDLAERLPRFRFRLVGGASGNEANFQTMCDRAAKLGNVSMAGFVPFSEIDSQFDGASLLVNTSPIEGFPNTFLQAWSRGIPSVSFFDPKVHLEGLAVGRTVADLEAMITEVERLKTEETHWKEHGRRAREYVRRNNSVSGVVSQYEMLFSEIMARPLSVGIQI